MKLCFVVQWVTPTGINNFKRNGTLFYPYERMEKMLKDSFEAGRRQGDIEGRVALRKLLDEQNNV